MADMQNMTVDRDEMKKAAGQIEDSSQAIHTIQSNLHQQIMQLLTMWKGNAATAFLSAYEQFDGRFADVQKQLDIIHEKLVASHTDYVSNEQEQTSASSAISSAINF